MGVLLSPLSEQPHDSRRSGGAAKAHSFAYQIAPIGRRTAALVGPFDQGEKEQRSPRSLPIDRECHSRNGSDSGLSYCLMADGGRRALEMNNSGGWSIATIYGFRVESYGSPLSRGFKRGLKRLRERGYDDPTCIVVKTKTGSHSGITHAGGRYVDSHNPYRIEVIRAMRDLGMEPPPALPFIVAPGECTLYHEWGHFVDRSWSKGDQEVTFSFRWFSHFYELGIRPSPFARVDQSGLLEYDDPGPIESSKSAAANAIVPWTHLSSELFADLFEDWMRGEKKVGWDHCEPDSLNTNLRDNPILRISLFPGVRPEDVRAKTYALFATGIRPAPDLPPVRSDLFGPQTSEMVDRLRDVLSDMRAGQL